ncbi:MAG TPA: hypothetical protein VNQ80_15050, partial [Parapedobacter sp.]|uniref:hypothetical protein n=1 Tax=Parapedobacter sp. TaxID=1958893 RepID=UPI002BA89C17
MNSRLLLGIFKKTALFVLLLTLFGGMYGFAQTSGYGDFIFLETFGQADPSDPSLHEFHPASRNYINSDLNTGIDVYFKTQPLPYINSLLFYIPSNPPDQYQVPGGTPNDRLLHQNNWGPQYRDNGQVGSYSVVTNSRGYRDSYFHVGLDHTPNDGELGYMLLVDAYSTTGLYFERDIEGLCAGTKFEFSAWIKDVNTEGSIQPRVRFEVFSVESNGSLGISLLDHVSESNYPVNEWREQKAEFVMPHSIDKIRLRISNAINEQQGNDIAIDDIGFRPMGPGLEFVVSPQMPVCSDDNVTFTAKVTQASEAYPLNHFILQRRAAGSTGAWEKVGEEDEYETSTGIGEVHFIVDDGAAYNNYEYRVVVAGDLGTLNEEKCRAVSEPILLQLDNHLPELSVEGGSSMICVNDVVELTTAVSGSVGDNPNYTYVWEKSIDQTTWEVVAGASGATLNSGALARTTYYRVTAYVGGVDGCPGAGASDVFEVTVNPLPVLTITNPTVVCAPGSVDLTASAVTSGSELHGGSLSYWADAAGTVSLSGAD